MPIQEAIQRIQVTEAAFGSFCISADGRHLNLDQFCPEVLPPSVAAAFWLHEAIAGNEVALELCFNLLLAEAKRSPQLPQVA